MALGTPMPIAPVIKIAISSDIAVKGATRAKW